MESDLYSQNKDEQQPSRHSRLSVVRKHMHGYSQGILIFFDRDRVSTPVSLWNKWVIKTQKTTPGTFRAWNQPLAWLY